MYTLFENTPFSHGYFFPRFHPQIRFLYHLKALVTENSKISSTKSSMECQEIITKHFFFCPSSSREFRHFVCLLFVAEFPDRLKNCNRRFYFGIFENNVVVFTLCMFGNTLVLFVGAPPQAH